MQIGRRNTSWNSQTTLYQRMLINRAKRQLSNDYYQTQFQNMSTALATARSNQISGIAQLTARAVSTRLSKSA